MDRDHSSDAEQCAGCSVLNNVASLSAHRHRIATRESNLAALRAWAMREQGRLVRRLPDAEREERLARLGEHEHWLRAIQRGAGR